MYEDLLVETQPGGRLEKFERVGSLVTEQVKNIYPNLPKEYLVFLEEIGSGEIGNAAYIIYNGVLTPDEIYDEVTAEDLNNILIFGDDMQGYCSGFDVENGWSVVEVDPTDMSFRKIFDNFSAFIRDKVKEV
ncbi:MULTISPECIES: SMI1/KNR4 family protein [unclassified Halomonas]|uniref:SMI1/KNR4 family protein n=1 Tax=unclassified Halomonas TaxID=2609666 RepID=UPI0007DA23AC|nr:MULTISPECIES: SMI1/KNR4 family protein [unclassified Halomonas]MBT2785960.1 SMI1/KNR4 family protein [Halomonas sp. ISL-106]MBT2796982.1 SMI1/KNR4 family protein [Halomonas sp. ISL-104]OAL58375.1 hypothetical protein A6R74_05620 [Halomonas sp. ALS9]